MKVRQFLPIALLCLFTTACQQILIRSHSATPSRPETPASGLTLSAVQTQQDWSLEQADVFVEGVVAAINQNQAQALLPFLLKRDQTLANAEAAIEDFKAYFHGEPIERFERLANAVTDASHQQFTYRLYSANGISKTLSVYQDQQQDPPVRLVDEFFLYSHWARVAVDRYAGALRTKDSALLARTLNAEDLPYPLVGAKQTLDTYAAKFDLSTLQYQFVGLDSERDRFIYQISGTKSGTPTEQPVSHLISVIYGDGLVSLEDEFVPPREAFTPDADTK